MENPPLRPEMDSPYPSPLNIHFRSAGSKWVLSRAPRAIICNSGMWRYFKRLYIQDRIVQSLIKLTQDKQKFGIQFCIFSVSFLFIYTVCPSAYSKDKTSRAFHRKQVINSVKPGFALMSFRTTRSKLSPTLCNLYLLSLTFHRLNTVRNFSRLFFRF